MILDYLLCLVLFIIIETISYKLLLKKTTQPKIYHALSQSALVMMISVTVMRFIPYFNMAQANSLLPHEHKPKAIILTAVVTVVWIISIWFARQKLTITPKHTRWPLWVRVIVYALWLLSASLVAFGSWFRAFFGQLTPEQVLFNLQSPIVGTADSMSMEIVFTPLFIILTCGILLLYVLFSTHKVTFRPTQKPRRVKLGIALSVVGVIASVVYVVVLLRLDSVYRTYVDSSSYIKNNYVDIRTVNPKFPETKRNLIHIYMESVENTYFDKRIGGVMPQNLMPELEQLTKEGVHFSHTEKMGGPHQTYGSSWSVAAMINMTSGIPLKVAMGGNDYGKSGYFLPGIYNLGDLLHDNGYEQTIMFGADADFGGLTTYFTSHGQFNIFDHKYAKKKKLIPNDYNVWWGFEDEKLYEYAKAELTRLSQTGKPFHFAMENADTHFPNGYITEKTPRVYDSQYANVIAYSQKQVVELIRWIQQQPFYSNTTVVVTGDHLSMDKDFFEKVDPSYHRTTYNVILNAPIKPIKTTNRQFSPLDFYPTILASMGITFDGNRAGLGTNLFSHEQTLIERDGLDKFNSELEKNSNFYNREFINEKKARKKYQQ